MMEAGNKEEAGPSHMLNEEDDYQDPAAAADHVYVPGPLLSLKDQIEKDKEDESLRRWKEKLLGCMESDLNGQTEPEVKLELCLLTLGR